MKDITQPRLLYRVSMLRDEIIQVLYNVEPSHHLSKGKGQVFSCNVDMEEEKLQVDHVLFHNDPIPQENSHYDKDDCNPSKNLEKSGKGRYAGKLAWGESIESNNFKGSQRFLTALE